MRILLYSKKSANPEQVCLISSLDMGHEQLMAQISAKGSLALLPEKEQKEQESMFLQAGYYHCGVKAHKIDLRRALKFDEKKRRELPKILHFISENKGALKRSIRTFYNLHYTIADPPVVIVISNRLFDLLEKEQINERNSLHGRIPEEEDPLFSLISLPQADPVLKNLESVFVGESIQARHTRALIYRASQTESPVLILGESGTGKDIIATQIQENSPFYNKGFYRVNCSALPESLFEGELFGYKRGIFTGAFQDKKGLFTAAKGGTIFLDELAISRCLTR